MNNGAADAIEAVEGMEHGNGIWPRIGVGPVGTDEDDAVVTRWDERGPFGVGERPRDGVVRGFFGEQGTWCEGYGEVEELECGVVFDVD